MLTPENGKSFDYGFVYDPEWLPGLSVNADYYRILLNNLIVQGPGIAQTILTDCFNTQGAICSNIFRAYDGSIKFVIESPFNAGNLVDQGLDVGAHYRLPTTAVGQLPRRCGCHVHPEIQRHRAGLHAASGRPLRQDVRQLRPRPRTGDVGLERGSVERELDHALRRPHHHWLRESVPGAFRLRRRCTRSVCSRLYQLDGSRASTGRDHVSQRFGRLQHRADQHVRELGVDNVFDKQPPLLYLNNVLNANTDVCTYDLLGRYYHASVTVKF